MCVSLSLYIYIYIYIYTYEPRGPPERSIDNNNYTTN